MKMKNGNETLSLAQSCQKLLRDYGHSELVYVTAEMQPFTSQFKPDIYFKPNKGARTNQLFFFELFRKYSDLPNDPILFFTDHKNFAEEYLEEKIFRYIVCGEERADEITCRILKKKGIVLTTEIVNPEDILLAMQDRMQS
jgi:hypothetical protein